MRTRKEASSSCFTRLAKASLFLSVSFGVPAIKCFDVQHRCVAVSRRHEPLKQHRDCQQRQHHEPTTPQCSCEPSTATTADRRTALVRTARTLALWTGAYSSAFFAARRRASALPSSLPGPPPPRERRQLELCLVAVLRVTFWAEALAEALEPSLASEEASAVAVTQESMSQKQPLQTSYLDARLGAKGVLTGRVGSGTSYRTFTLATLQVPNCLQDLQLYRPNVASTAQDFREALASLVEFDGMDSLLEPSPRTSLTLAQYSDAKRIFVARTLRERVVPLGRKLVSGFDAVSVDRAMTYIQSYYSSELITPVPSPSAMPLTTS